MAYHIHKNELSELIVEQASPYLCQSAKIQDNYYHMEEPTAKGSLHEIAMNNFHIINVSLETQCPLKVHTNIIDPMVGISFMLKGRGLDLYELNHVTHRSLLQAGQLVLGYGCAPVTFEFEENISHEVFELHFSLQAFENIACNYGKAFEVLLSHMYAQSPGVIATCYHDLSISPQMYAVIHQIRHCEFSDDLRRMYLQTKAVELITLIAHELEQESTKFSFSHADKDKLYDAREALIQNMATPPTIPELARIVGLNEFKLKKGFKELFGNSVFAYLLDIKLEKAKEMLLEGSKNVGEVSAQIGYQNQAHFTKAFKKKFGIPPRQLLKN